MNLSPWFKPSDLPVRDGKYQVKDWIGCIRYREWFRDHWRDEAYDLVPMRTIREWRGVVA